MIFSKNIQRVIRDKFNENLQLGLLEKDILTQLKNCSDDVQVILEFFYSTMTASDIGDYDFDLYKKFADFGVFLADNSQWKEPVPEDIFFNYVLYYRINNEAVEDCRRFFYDALRDRINGKSMKKAALEVNTWCAEHVIYQSTDDRTASPLTVLKSSYGRCGEESTLLVTALRSVGIPARQVYTPRWAHCDDNHAWVEVWCDGEWYYLGACEPEPVLNKGWFDNASGRAMLVDTKAYLPVEGEEVISREGQTLILNEVSRYAPSGYFTVTVKDELPVAGVIVHFEVLNGSEFFPIASITTDESGNAGLTLGFGSIHIHAVKDCKFAEAFVNTADSNSVVLDFSHAVFTETEYCEDFDFTAPKDSMKNSAELTEEQENERSLIIEKAHLKRKEYANSFYQEEKAEELAVQFTSFGEVTDILKAAEGNFCEIYDFLAMNSDDLDDLDDSDDLDDLVTDKELRLKLLKCLKKKGYRDVKCNVLREHFIYSLKYQKDYPQEIFLRYIMCPRAYYEELTPYREFILTLFNKHKIELFREHPGKVWEYVSKFRSNPGRQNDRLTGTPKGTILSGYAGLKEQRILFTAICRTLGIPARINTVTMTAEYYENGEFKSVEDDLCEYGERSGLILTGGLEKWVYLQNWTMAVLNEGSYKTLDFSDFVWKNGRMECSLNPGSYRIITSNRLPNGNQFARKYCFSLEAGRTKTLDISLRQMEISNLITDIFFTPFRLYYEDEVTTSEAVSTGRAAVFIWLEEGHEPTEHILNEFIQSREEVNRTECDINFIIRGDKAFENDTFRGVLKAIPGAKVYFSDFSDTAETMARRMYVNPENLPLTVIAKDSRGIYACSGYNVGIVNLLLKIINLQI